MGQAKYSYFDILKKRVLRYVKHYQNDFLIHDKDSLLDYQGEAIFAMRECGTTIMKLIQKKSKDTEFDQNEILPWIFQENTEFYHLANGKARGRGTRYLSLH